MRLIRIIDNGKAQYGELFDMDYESLGEHWFHSLAKNEHDDEAPCVTVGDVYELTAINKNSYSVMKLGFNPGRDIPSKNKNWKRSFSLNVPKDIGQILTDEEVRLYGHLFE